MIAGTIRDMYKIHDKRWSDRNNDKENRGTFL